MVDINLKRIKVMMKKKNIPPLELLKIINERNGTTYKKSNIYKFLNGNNKSYKLAWLICDSLELNINEVYTVGTE
ncbi:hypothetical protein [Clostridium sp.]|uniref:hypothetical protein n=1 Tax=Clostridium sp. TaxID=1506 RepID=UPI002FCB9367